MVTEMANEAEAARATAVQVRRRTIVMRTTLTFFISNPFATKKPFERISKGLFVVNGTRFVGYGSQTTLAFTL